MKNTIIFDLDGTLALIDERRRVSDDGNGKIDWDKFFDPKNIDLDVPNEPVVHMCRTLKDDGFNIVIFSGRSDRTKVATISWLKNNNVPFDKLHMRPEEHIFMPDNDLKVMWLNSVVDKDDIFMVFDDRNQVVKMWRENGITVFQVADGDF